MAITPVGTDAQIGASIAALDLLSRDVLRVRIHCDAPIGFRPGQYVTILREGGLARSYSIASLQEESEIELHVRKIRGGAMSGWLHETARVGERISVLGPSGDCFYVPGKDNSH
ncbi:MAG: FAD-binding oxidoreductase, partial [Bryobacteraceae bacterium]